jgi:ribosomal protein S18 acetylase RimI-like enzyme
MMRVTVMSGAEADRDGVLDQIIQFDRLNMGSVLAAADVPFPEDKRRKSLGGATQTIVAVFDETALVGYLEFGPSWDDPDDLFIASVQVAPSHRKTMVLAQCVAYAAADLESRRFRRAVTSAQVTNAEAIDLYKKLGFRVVDRSDRSVTLVADRKLLEARRIRRWRERYGV